MFIHSSNTHIQTDLQTYMHTSTYIDRYTMARAHTHTNTSTSQASLCQSRTEPEEAIAARWFKIELSCQLIRMVVGQSEPKRT